jgi:hypothetical protein
MDRSLAWQARAARILCEAPKASHGFDRAAFANDPRIKAMKWERWIFGEALNAIRPGNQSM